MLTRDIVTLPSNTPDSFLAATGDPALWSVPLRSEATLVQGRRTARPVQNSLRLDISGGRLQLDLSSGQRIHLSLLEHMARVAPPSDSRMTPPRHTAPGLMVSSDEAWGTLAINGRPVSLPQGARAVGWSCAASGAGVALATATEVLWINPRGEIRWRRPMSISATGVNVAGDGKLVVVVLSDGTLRWLTADEGRLVLSAVVLSDAATWAAWTPSGYYDASADGEQLLSAVFPPGVRGLRDWARATRMQDTLRRPDVIERVLFTLNEAQALEEADAASGQRGIPLARALPPHLVIEDLHEEIEASAPALGLRVSVQVPSGLPLVSLQARVLGAAGRALKQVNQAPQALPSRPDDPPGLTRYALLVSLLPEDCSVLVQAETQHATSEPAVVRIRWRGPLRPAEQTLPNLNVLAVGVSLYQEAALHLEYPAKDALDLVALLRKQVGKLYAQVNATTLVDKEATRARILSELARLRRTATSDDVIIVFMAGHGVSDALTGRYYFYPHEADPADMTATTLPANELRAAVLTLPGKVVLLLDTCHAGGSLDRRAALREGDLQRLAGQVATAESNIVVFTASTGAQVARESRRWGNGVFSKALLEGLRGKADGTGSGLVSVSQLEAYVSSRVRELTADQQTPAATKPSSTVDFPLTRVPLPLQRRWWFWGALGLTAAGIVTGAVVGAAPWREPLPRVAF